MFPKFFNPTQPTWRSARLAEQAGCSECGWTLLTLGHSDPFPSPLMFKCQREIFFPSQRIWYYSIWGKILLNTKLSKANWKDHSNMPVGKDRSNNHETHIRELQVRNGPALRLAMCSSGNPMTLLIPLITPWMPVHSLTPTEARMRKGSKLLLGARSLGNNNLQNKIYREGHKTSLKI